MKIFNCLRLLANNSFHSIPLEWYNNTFVKYTSSHLPPKKREMFMRNSMGRGGRCTYANKQMHIKVPHQSCYQIYKVGCHPE